MDSLLKGQVFQQLSFFGTIYNVAYMAAGKFAVDDFQFIAINVVDAQFVLQEPSEIGESARQDGGFKSILPQSADQTLGAFCNRHLKSNLTHYIFIEAFQ